MTAIYAAPPEWQYADPEPVTPVDRGVAELEIFGADPPGAVIDMAVVSPAEQAWLDRVRPIVMIAVPRLRAWFLDSVILELDADPPTPEVEQRLRDELTRAVAP